MCSNGTSHQAGGPGWGLSPCVRPVRSLACILPVTKWGLASCCVLADICKQDDEEMMMCWMCAVGDPKPDTQVDGSLFILSKGNTSSLRLNYVCLRDRDTFTDNTNT